MSAPTRFLAVAVFSWIGIRATAGMLDLVPSEPMPDVAAAQSVVGMSPLPAYAEAPLPAYAEAPLPAAPAGAYAPITGAYSPSYGYPVGAAAPARPVYYPYPVYPAPAPMPASYRAERPWMKPTPDLNFAGLPPAEDAPLPRLATPAPRATAPVPSFTGPQRSGFDRLSLTSWALVRQQQPTLATTPAEPGLATGGTLGGSQAGARFTWRWNRSLALNARVSAPINYQQRKIAGEAALGVTWQPLQSLPVRLMAERRHPIGAPGGGRKAFALLAEGGVYEQPLPWSFRLDGYAQSGIVGVRQPDWFIDGGATATRPIFGRFALGAGVWGGAQAGLSRFDVGPRLSMQLRPGVRTHLDYRHRLFGNAEPGSGFAATLATDF